MYLPKIEFSGVKYSIIYLEQKVTNRFKKDPNATLDYIIDLASASNGRGEEDYLQIGEVISSATIFSSSNNINIDSYDLADNNTSVVIWLSSGIEGEEYTVTCHFSTNLGRTDDRSIYITMVQK